MEPKRPCYRSRFTCNLCKQSLGYSAFRRHQDLPHMYCQGYSSASTNSTQRNASDSLSSTFEFDDLQDSDYPAHQPVKLVENHNDEQSTISSSESESSSDNSDSGAEVWDETEECCSDSETEASQSPEISQLTYFVCLFLSFFQLCFHISDRALSLLLSFISALLRHISSRVNDSAYNSFMKAFPSTLYSLRKNLKLKKSYKKFVVCPYCHKLFKTSETEPIKDTNGIELSPKCDHIQYPNHPLPAHRKVCGTELLKRVKVGQSYKFVPRKLYVYYNIIESLQQILARPRIVDMCEKWREYKQNVPSGYLTDVYDGRLWTEWATHNGKSFLQTPGNLLLMLNVDWFQPFVHTQYSVGVMYLVIQNLPRSIRFKAENVIIVSTIPGPKEPDCNHMNNYLEPMVNDLLLLWKGINIKIPQSVLGSKLIRAALSYISSDLPATRKLCGFYGYHATYGCSKCLKKFPSTFTTSPDYSGFDRNLWQPRSFELHRNLAQRVKSAVTRSDRLKTEQEAGVRYSDLLRLPYLDIVRCHLIDPMHNLFLGTSKRMLHLWKDRGFLNNSAFEKIQEQIDSIIPPSNIGRIPSKISAGFAGFTAEQWMHWTTLYTLLLYYRNIYIPLEHYTHWCLYSKACSLMCRTYIHLREIEQADELLMSFCTGLERLYGKEAITPNMHLHGHLKECILDVGPLYSFWCFSFERYNGILEKMKKSWHAPEQQLIHKFSNLQTLAATVLPPDLPLELVQIFTQAKECETALPDLVISGLVVLKYEHNLMCLPQEMCAIKQPFQYLVPPGREKYMLDNQRQDLLLMYRAIYENVIHVPLRYTEFNQIKVFNYIYTSTKSRTTRSAAFIAIWPHLSRILTSRRPQVQDVRVGIIENFLIHTPEIKQADGENLQQPHVLAYVKWYQDHPQKFFFSNGIVISATVTEQTSGASFMPVSRILSQCAFINMKVKFEYGEDKVCVTIPAKRHYLF